MCVCLLPSHLGLPHEPELKDVDVPATLDGFVPCVVGDVVLFVWLEQVAGTHGVTACQDSLQTHIKYIHVNLFYTPLLPMAC